MMFGKEADCIPPVFENLQEAEFKSKGLILVVRISRPPDIDFCE